MGHFRQSERWTPSFLWDRLNISYSPAWTVWTVKIHILVSDALTEPY